MELSPLLNPLNRTEIRKHNKKTYKNQKKSQQRWKLGFLSNTFAWPEQLFIEGRQLLSWNWEDWSFLEGFLLKSLKVTIACQGFRGKLLEEQNAFEMTLGCFLGGCFIWWAGEEITELCFEDALLIVSSKIFRYKESTWCSRFATSSSSNSISVISSFALNHPKHINNVSQICIYKKKKKKSRLDCKH